MGRNRNCPKHTQKLQLFQRTRSHTLSRHDRISLSVCSHHLQEFDIPHVNIYLPSNKRSRSSAVVSFDMTFNTTGEDDQDWTISDKGGKP